jgi:hypothetical protein
MAFDILFITFLLLIQCSNCLKYSDRYVKKIVDKKLNLQNIENGNDEIKIFERSKLKTKSETLLESINGGKLNRLSKYHENSSFKIEASTPIPSKKPSNNPTSSPVTSSPIINERDAQWGMYRGNDYTNRGKSLYTGPSITNLLYTYKTNSDSNGNYGIVSTPVIDADNVIYFSSYDGYLYAMYPNQSLKWKCSLYNNASMLQHVSLTSAAIRSDNSVIVATESTLLYAITSTGSQLWKFYTYGYIIGAPIVG